MAGRKIMRHVCQLLIVVLAFAPGAVRGDDKDAIEKKVVEIVKKSGAFYKDAKSISVKAVYTTTADGDDQEKKETVVTASVQAERPNQFALRTKLDNDAGAGPDVI